MNLSDDGEYAAQVDRKNSIQFWRCRNGSKVGKKISVLGELWDFHISDNGKFVIVSLESGVANVLSGELGKSNSLSSKIDLRGYLEVNTDSLSETLSRVFLDGSRLLI